MDDAEGDVLACEASARIVRTCLATTRARGGAGSRPCIAWFALPSSQRTLAAATLLAASWSKAALERGPSALKAAGLGGLADALKGAIRGDAQALVRPSRRAYAPRCCSPVEITRLMPPFTVQKVMLAALSVLAEVAGSGGTAAPRCACSFRLREAAQRVVHHAIGQSAAGTSDLGPAAAAAGRVAGRAFARALQALARRNGATSGGSSGESDGVALMRSLEGAPPPLLAACAARWSSLGQALPAFMEAECRRAAEAVVATHLGPGGAAPPALAAGLGRASALARVLACAGSDVRRTVLARLATVGGDAACSAGVRAGARLLAGEAGEGSTGD